MAYMTSDKVTNERKTINRAGKKYYGVYALFRLLFFLNFYSH